MMSLEELLDHIETLYQSLNKTNFLDESTRGRFDRYVDALEDYYLLIQDDVQVHKSVMIGIYQLQTLLNQSLNYVFPESPNFSHIVDGREKLGEMIAKFILLPESTPTSSDEKENAVYRFYEALHKELIATKEIDAILFEKFLVAVHTYHRDNLKSQTLPRYILGTIYTLMYQLRDKISNETVGSAVYYHAYDKMNTLRETIHTLLDRE